MRKFINRSRKIVTHNSCNERIEHSSSPIHCLHNSFRCWQTSPHYILVRCRFFFFLTASEIVWSLIWGSLTSLLPWPRLQKELESGCRSLACREKCNDERVVGKGLFKGLVFAGYRAVYELYMCNNNDDKSLLYDIIARQEREREKEERELLGRIMTIACEAERWQIWQLTAFVLTWQLRRIAVKRPSSYLFQIADLFVSPFFHHAIHDNTSLCQKEVIWIYKSRRVSH